MAWGRWWAYIQDYVKSEPDKFGVYELGDDLKNTVYYGSGEIKTRLLDHLNKRECPMASNYRFELFPIESQCRSREEELLEEYKRIHGQLPMYN